MADVPKTIKTWQMVAPWRKNKETGEKIPGQLQLTEIPVPELKEGDVLVKIAGCGVCHTDLGFFFDAVPTVTKPPLTLGHEVSGTVVAGDPKWIGKEVLIPAVLPCRKCELCKTGRGNRCLNQMFIGCSHGIYGGNSDYIPVPSLDLCEIKNRPSTRPLENYSVASDAVTTPYQAMIKAKVGIGDNVIVIGATGGVGLYTAQIAKAMGADVVIGIDIAEQKLQKMLNYGCDFVIMNKDKSNKDVMGEYRAICKANALPNYGWKIFEVSGNKFGQALALDLLSFTGTMVQIGYGLGSIDFNVSRLMAFDAQIIGTWACLPEYYPHVLSLIHSGKIQIDPFLEVRPMSTIAATYDEVHKAGSPEKRIVLKPDF
ncbi:6-hydroxycyclohex-1-ene-1-carbonyl-CoA dehydrogenase [Syntrophus aciditrophicus]|uniref:6-hydroxycyclohex-1-ene-1-carboxyl-CoA dehydrogenase n=1 Tax=Syntrophus aciditrophicus (strain SB) TaxID=56780 RepID=Q2LXU3_SYNAS|nr:6-hydroxycyclohex-1-ene-1-carbonyl-CoA dehydrogenase [Syntrophus aciditrophicus]ABC78904.1 6-hydroxycyclohex-1-ene-1-carboxyl-CoA dehydrogenase [Syntrophus aciditrophicus SB]